MIYLLGGPPRVGKSKIATRITTQHGISSVSTDSLAAVLESVLDPETAPGLFAVDAMPLAARIEMMAGDTRRRIDLQIEESRSTWRAVAPFIRREAEEGRDLLVEGVAVLPEFVAQLEGIDHRAVLVGHRDGDHEANIRQGAAKCESDWMRDASDDYIRAFAVFVDRMSLFFAEQSQRHGLAYVEMSGMPFDDAVDAVIRSLIGEHPVNRTTGRAGR
jgi:2-phosphoglycerate kinase